MSTRIVCADSYNDNGVTQVWLSVIEIENGESKGPIICLPVPVLEALLRHVKKVSAKKFLVELD